MQTLQPMLTLSTRALIFKERMLCRQLMVSKLIQGSSLPLEPGTPSISQGADIIQVYFLSVELKVKTWFESAKNSDQNTPQDAAVQAQVIFSSSRLTKPPTQTMSLATQPQCRKGLSSSLLPTPSAAGALISFSFHTEFGSSLPVYLLFGTAHDFTTILHGKNEKSSPTSLVTAL